ncbi:isocitrate lyase/phosphoenolpyruvate mutase family protein [Paenibacillus sp. LMG 31458]|uniref:Isocitrate lyase/phosphoenolpyruvate mutase family protein n=1 Tax=Paenibacillus phytorum TaxID=2654977 RepID=A0ABX1XSX4_9BACL|nr:isocitrate lyase/phosphoenolpyruvate mutase family protein [Paenibacillus phytorum]NOU70940.1 isocitrate lyase/phosphoenolpyruvate mutase family protein [Paenibacillus phytorum]
MNRIQEFNALHESNEVLLLGNAWDLLSALSLEKAGFKAIGTTSWGVAKSLGYSDGEMIEFAIQQNVVKMIVDHVKIPVTADIESGYGEDDQTIVDNVLKLADLGASGINIEDSLKNQAGLKPLDQQCHLLSKIRTALEKNGYQGFYINARTDTYLQNQDPLNETIYRAKAYVESGASGIFVPGLKEDDEIRVIISQTNAPLNIMSLPGLTSCNKLKELGVKRLSIGGALYRKVNNLLDHCAAQIYESQDTSILFN